MREIRNLMAIREKIMTSMKMARTIFPILVLLMLGFFGLSTIYGQAGGTAGGGGGGGTSGGAQGIGENTIIIRETPENLAKIEQIIKSLDVAPTQVLIEANIFDISLDHSNSTGMDWSAIITQLGRDGPLWQYNHATGMRDSSGNPSGNGNMQFGTLDNEHFTLLLSGLKKDNRARALSNPKVTALSGQQAIISIEKKIPYYTTTTYPANGGNPPYTVTSVQDVDVPIKLTVTPTIFDDGTIRLKVKPEITKTLGTLVAGTKPSTEKRYAETDVVVKNSETLILGGLITEDSSDGKDSVPLFDKIPFIRKLFSKQSKANIRSELAVFITPNIIESRDIKSPVTALVKTAPLMVEVRK